MPLVHDLCALGRVAPPHCHSTCPPDKLNPSAVGYEGNFHVDDAPEEWDDFYKIEALYIRIYAKTEKDACVLREKLTKVVYDGTLTDDLEHWGLDNFDVGLIEETKGYDAHHKCECNCRHECGALPLPPCPPAVEVDGEYVVMHPQTLHQTKPSTPNQRRVADR